MEHLLQSSKCSNFHDIFKYIISKATLGVIMGQRVKVFILDELLIPIITDGWLHYWFWFDLTLYVPVNIFSVMSRRVFLGWTTTKQGKMCLAQEHNTVMPVRLEPAAPRSRVKHFPTEPLIRIDSLNEKVWILISWFQQPPADLALHCFQKRV